jgi:uncharacterized protein (TIGR02145 family)
VKNLSFYKSLNKMKRTKRFLGIIPILFFLLSSSVLKAQIPAAIDTKMKSDNMRNFQLEEIKVRWKKAALENCPGVPCVTAPSFTCGTSTIVDMDGNSYNSVSIGTQCWLKENLKVGKYNDGTVIPLDATGGTAGNVSPESWSAFTSGAKTVFEHNPTNLNALGYLYNWHAAVDIRGICPIGWKIPSKLEWQALETILSVGGDAGLKMMVTTRPYGWTTSTKTNSSGFTALSSGYRLGTSGLASNQGKFIRADVPGATPSTFYTKWWSSDSVSPISKDVAVLEDQLTSGFYLDDDPPNLGASIRCIKI